MGHHWSQGTKMNKVRDYWWGGKLVSILSIIVTIKRMHINIYKYIYRFIYSTRRKYREGYILIIVFKRGENSPRHLSTFYNTQRYTKMTSSMLHYHSYLYTYMDKNVFWDYIIDRTCICLYTLQYFIYLKIIKLF